VQNVNSQDMVCGQSGSKSQTVINVKAGDRIGALYQHVIGGAQFPNDPDNPIAPSHKGPVMVYLAKVDNAASASQNGLKWYVVPEIRGRRGSSLTSCAGSRFGKMRSIPAAGNGVLTT
jgi:cellulase